MAYKGLDLEGRNALVFGGTSGIGKAIALGLAEAGADVIPVSRTMEKVSKTAAEIRALGRRSLELTADVRRRTEIQRAIEVILSKVGCIDILVNSAGITKRTPSFELPEEDWHHILDVNLNGTWHACQLVGEAMRDRGYGRIINLASIASHLAANEVMAYCVSKGGIAMLTRALAAEWAKYHITVNALAPGVFETPLNHDLIHEPGRKRSIFSHTPMKRFGNLEEIKGAAIFLASDSASFVTGHILFVDGGFVIQGVGD